MLNAILIDAGPLIALFDKDDAYHPRVLTFIKDKRYKFVTTWAVVTEVMHMLDFSVAAQTDFLQWIMNEGVRIHELAQHDLARVIELTQKYSDLPMDFADATLVIAAEQNAIRRIISLDSGFDVYRLPSKVKIENVFRRNR
jgi:predicted nucleic acid-binding protein